VGPNQRAERGPSIVPKSMFYKSVPTSGLERKFKRYMDLQKPSLTVVGEFSYLLEDVSNAYIAGNLYSALTGACCLGERIFNQIIFGIADYHKSSSHYKKVHGRGSFNDWSKAIDILKDWNVLGVETEKAYRRLAVLRNEAIHYQPKTQDVEEMSLEAINLVNKIIEDLFSLFRKDVLLVFNVPGEIHIKKEAETIPLVQEFYLPCSVHVGYKYTIELDASIPPNLTVIDDHNYEEAEVTDEEFVQLRNEYLGRVKA
jgi:hypothetical protein